jgi:hypothetical protein
MTDKDELKRRELAEWRRAHVAHNLADALSRQPSFGQRIMKKIKWTVLVLILICMAGLFVIWMHDDRIKKYSIHCGANFCHIDSAKEQWALKHSATDGTVVTVQQLQEIDKHIGYDRCFSGGKLTIGALGEPPSCTIHGSMDHRIRVRTILFYRNSPYE